MAEAGAEEGAGFRGLGKPNEENPALKLGDVFLPTALSSYARPLRKSRSLVVAGDG